MVESTVSAEAPRLPPAYRLITVAPGTDVCAAAVDLLRQDTDDGTLVWAAPEPEATGAAANLRVALALYPEADLLTACQLGYVMALGLGDALGSALAAGSDVVFEWPGRLMLNAGLAGTVTVHHPEVATGADLPWVVLGATVHVGGVDSGSPLEVAVLRDEGSPDVRADLLLEHFGRHFLVWVNRWLDDGFEPVRAMWLRHTVLQGREVELPLRRGKARGVFDGLDGEGRALLKGRHGHRRRLAWTQTPAAVAVPS